MLQGHAPSERSRETSLLVSSSSLWFLAVLGGPWLEGDHSSLCPHHPANAFPVSMSPPCLCVQVNSLYNDISHWSGPIQPQCDLILTCNTPHTPPTHTLHHTQTHHIHHPHTHYTTHDTPHTPPTHTLGESSSSPPLSFRCVCCVPVKGHVVHSQALEIGRAHV